MKLEFFRQNFEKYSNIKFHKNPLSGSRVVRCGQTDRHDEANSRFSQFCEKLIEITKFFTTKSYKPQMKNKNYEALLDTVTLGRFHPSTGHEGP